MRSTVNQSPYGGDWYPFVTRDVANGAIQDFYAAGPWCSDKYPFRLEWIHGVGSAGGTAPSGFPTPVHTVDLLLVDAEGSIVFDSTEATFTESNWGSRKVAQWRTDTSVVRLVYVPDVTLNTSVALEAALDSRTINRTTDHVTSILAGIVTMTGRMELEAGFNMRLSVPEQVRTDGGTFENRIVFDAVPGFGLGKVRGCEDGSGGNITDVNGQTADESGNFLIEVDNCFRLLPVAVPAAPGDLQLLNGGALPSDEAKHAIRLVGDCEPCCPCSYFVRTYAGITRILNRAVLVADQLEETRDVYADNIERWRRSLRCRISRSVYVRAFTQNVCYLDAVVAFCNLFQACLRPVQVVVQFSAPIAGNVFRAKMIGSSVPNGEMEVSPEGSFPTYTFRFEAVEVGTSAVVQMRMYFPGCVTGMPVRVTGRVYFPEPPFPLPTDFELPNLGTSGESLYPLRGTGEAAAPLSDV